MKWRKRNPQLSDEIARLSGLEPHELLGVPQEPTADQLKRAYRKLAKVYHPDRADPFMKNHNEQVIKLINDAYARLNARLEART